MAILKTVPYKLDMHVLNSLRLSKRLQFPILLLVGGLVAWPFNSAVAVPANPEPQEVTQPDGTNIQLRLRGDEYFHWTETTNGYAVVKDTDNFWKYARPATNRAEFRAISGARVGSDNPGRLGLRQHDLPDAKLVRSLVEENRRGMKGEPKELPVTKSSTNKTSAATTPSSADQSTNVPPPDVQPPDEPPHPIPVQGVKSIKNLVILACFSDQWDSANNTVLPAYGRPPSDYDPLFNQVGYNADGAVGSVKDYYIETSYGKLTINSTVTVWVQLPHVQSYYHNNQGALAADAVAAADAQGVDFTQFDSDGDGWVDILDIIHSGYGEEAGGGLHPDWVWSVQGSMSSVFTQTKNGVSVKLYKYHTEPALRGNSGTGISRIGVIAHETGHFFGLPDLYDYSSTTDGLGYWCEMSGGTWNGGDGKSPAHFSAWAKVFLGFAKTVPVHSKTRFSLPRVEDNDEVGMLRDGMSNDEYFLIENRAQVGFDNDPNIHPGLVIYHVDQQSANNDLGTWPHPAVKIEEADGNDSLGSKTAMSQGGDVWTSTTGLASGFRDQTGNQSANAMMYQTPISPATYSYNRSDSSASYSYNRLNNFSAAGSTMTFDVQSLKTDAPKQNALPAPFTVAWAPSSEATKYEIQESSPTTLTSFFDGAENADDLQDNWYVAGKTLRSSGGSHAGSYSYALLQANYGNVQSMMLRKPFKVTASTVISFYLMSHVAPYTDSGMQPPPAGTLQCQVSNDGGNTWKTLGVYNGYINSWSSRSYNYTTIHTAGINEGDMCSLRFVVDIEYIYGWSGFPNTGFALDDISITDTEIAGYGNWTSLNNNVTATSYTISGKTAGTYAYRVQAYANDAWQGYGSVGETTVRANQAPVWTVNPITGSDANVAIPYSGSIANQASDEVNDVMTFSKVSGPAWLTVCSDGTIAGTPPAGSGGLNSFTVRVTDSAGNHADTTLTVFVNTPIADWRMNESAGPTISDSVGSFNGTAAGTLSYHQAGAPNAGVGNYAIGFSGSGTAVSVPALNLNSSTVTITALIRISAGQPYRAPIFMWRGTAMGLRFDDNTGSGNSSNHTLSPVWSGSGWISTLVVPENQWTFVAMVVGPSSLTVYMSTGSGVSSYTVNNTFASAAFDTASYIGWDSNYAGDTRRFNGTMDDVAVYGTSLTASQVSQLATAAFVQQPVANSDSYSRAPGVGIKIRASDLLANDTVASSYTPAYDSCEATTANGVTLGVSGSGSSTMIIYPSSAGNSADSFHYTMSDGHGGIAAGTVSISINTTVTGPQANISVNSGAATMTFYGIPNYHYAVQRSSDLSTWTDIMVTSSASVDNSLNYSVVTAPVGGAFTVTDSSATGTSAYYRLRAAP